MYFLSRFLETSNDIALQQELKSILRDRILEHIGCNGDALCIAMRLLTCNYVGVSNPSDLATLRSM